MNTTGQLMLDFSQINCNLTYGTWNGCENTSLRKCPHILLIPYLPMVLAFYHLKQEM